MGCDMTVYNPHYLTASKPERLPNLYLTKCVFRFPLQILTETFLRCDKYFVSMAQVVAGDACRKPVPFSFLASTARSGRGPPQYRGCTITLTRHSGGLLWTSDQPDAETST